MPAQTRTLRWWLAAWLGGALWLAAAAAEAPPRGGGHAPKLVCDQPVYNFGELDSAGEVEHTFVLRNAGDLSLQIRSLRPTCGCTVGKLADEIVRPGGTTTVSVVFVLRGREGPQSKLLYVLSDDPAQPEFPLTLEGKVVEPVSVEPRILFFGRLDAAAAATGTVAVTANDHQPLQITKLQVEVPCLSAQLVSAASDQTQRVVVATKPPLPEGLTRTLLVLHTSHPRQPRIELTVSFFVPGVFAVNPPELFLVGRPQERLNRELTIRSEKNTPFKILAVEPPRPDITARVTALSNAVYRVELGNIEVVQGLDGQILRVTTDQAHRPEILIPMRVFIR
ncbi:MAG: DUF1573 domain-containing protein [Kiritimatiellaeota bacterium]|nr:DUF1573 domain-containing protein [Kiritimatiellota bacterium]